MDFTSQAKDRVLEGLTVQAADELEKRKGLPRPITPVGSVGPLEAEAIKPMKLAASRKVWWPASCRGIVG